MSRFRGRLVLGLGVLLTATLTALPVPTVNAAAPPPDGGPVTTLATDGLGPQVVTDRAGNTTVVWATDWWRGPIRAVRRPAGGDWRTPVTIGRGTFPQAAVDAAGNVTVLFETNRPGFTTGQAAVRRPVGRAWQAPVRLSDDRPAANYTGDGEGAFGAHRAELAVSPRGAVVVGWQWGSYDRDRPFRIEAVYRPARGAWGDPVQLTGRDWSEWAVVGVDRAGNATVAYDTPGEGVLSRRRVVGEGWRAAVRVVPTDSGLGKQLVVDPAGNATMTYSRYRNGKNIIHAVRRPASGTWGASRRISPPGVYIWGSDMVVDASGTVSVAMDRRSGRVDVVRRPAGGGWRAPVEVAPAGEANIESVRVATNRRGDLYVLWDNETTGLTGRIRHPGEGWTPAFVVSLVAEYVESLDIAVQGNGDVVTVWQNGARDVLVRRHLKQ